MSEKEKWNAGDRPAGKASPGWEKKLVTDLALASFKEQRRSRRWGIFFRLLGFVYISILLFTFLRGEYDFLDFDKKSNDHTAVVDVYGVIAADQMANANAIISGMKAAFKDKDTKAVLLRINSPGGSPVQSGMIYDEMVRLQEEYTDIPLYAVIEDTGASGGYYIAAAAAKIYADKASLVGSIGVRMDSFGFVDAMEKLGVERRTLTAGSNKALLDPFSPLKENQKQHLASLLDNIHQQFIEAVKKGRGDRLNMRAQLFTGLVWSGEQAVTLGLVDELMSEREIAENVVGVKKRVNFTPEEDIFARVAGRLGASFNEALSTFMQDSTQLQ